MIRNVLLFSGLATVTVIVWLAIPEPDAPSGMSHEAPAKRTAADHAAAPVQPTVIRNESTAPERTITPDWPEDGYAATDDEESRLGAGAHPVRAPDFDRLLTAYDAVSSATLEAFNARYADAIAFRTPAEFEWLNERGFPLPEEILAAADMPLAELRALADKGDRKARFLYLDRTLQEVRELRQSYLRSGISPDGLHEIPEYGDALVQAAYAKSHLTDSNSPFAGYLMAEFSRVALGNPYGYMAGLLHATHQGDARAYGKLNAFMKQNDICSDSLAAMGAYAVIVEGRSVQRNLP